MLALACLHSGATMSDLTVNTRRGAKVCLVSWWWAKMHPITRHTAVMLVAFHVQLGFTAGCTTMLCQRNC